MLRCFFSCPATGRSVMWFHADPAGGPVWKVDLWTARAAEFARGSPNRARWAALLTEEARVHILAIKEAVCGLPEYRRELLSIHIYEAVLDRGVRGIEQFKDWWLRVRELTRIHTGGNA